MKCRDFSRDLVHFENYGSYSGINNCQWWNWERAVLTHLPPVPDIWVGEWIIIGSRNGLAPNTTWTHAGLLWIGLLRKKFKWNLHRKSIISIKKMHLKMSSAKVSAILVQCVCVCEEGDELIIHDDVIKWKHFPRYWPFLRGIHRSPVNSPHKDQWRGALMFSMICA